VNVPCEPLTVLALCGTFSFTQRWCQRRLGHTMVTASAFATQSQTNATRLFEAQAPITPIRREEVDWMSVIFW
jgi:hypothetical protein